MMATGFLTALGAVPWPTVIERAPGLIDQGIKLLGSLRGRKETAADLPPTDEIDALHDLVHAQGAEIASLRADLTHATELIVEMSRDQAALIGQVRMLRAWCLCAGGVATVALVGILFMAIR